MPLSYTGLLCRQLLDLFCDDPCSRDTSFDATGVCIFDQLVSVVSIGSEHSRWSLARDHFGDQHHSLHPQLLLHEKVETHKQCFYHATPPMQYSGFICVSFQCTPQIHSPVRLSLANHCASNHVGSGFRPLTFVLKPSTALQLLIPQ